MSQAVHAQLWVVCSHVRRNPKCVHSKCRLNPPRPVAGELLCKKCLDQVLDKSGPLPVAGLELMFESQVARLCTLPVATDTLPAEESSC